MPSTIPYDPSLALGAIVNPSAIETLTQISGLSAEIDAAQENLNSFISMNFALLEVAQPVQQLDAVEIGHVPVKHQQVIGFLPQRPAQRFALAEGTAGNHFFPNLELSCQCVHQIAQLGRIVVENRDAHGASRWIDANVARVRSHLGLASFHGGEWRLNNVRYAGYKLSKDHGKKQPKMLSAAQRQFQHQSESSP